MKILGDNYRGTEGVCKIKLDLARDKLCKAILILGVRARLKYVRLYKISYM